MEISFICCVLFSQKLFDYLVPAATWFIELLGQLANTQVASQHSIIALITSGESSIAEVRASFGGLLALCTFKEALKMPKAPKAKKGKETPASPPIPIENAQYGCVRRLALAVWYKLTLPLQGCLSSQSAVAVAFAHRLPESLLETLCDLVEETYSHYRRQRFGEEPGKDNDLPELPPLALSALPEQQSERDGLARQFYQSTYYAVETLGCVSRHVSDMHWLNRLSVTRTALHEVVMPLLLRDEELLQRGALQYLLAQSANTMPRPWSTPTDPAPPDEEVLDDGVPEDTQPLIESAPLPIDDAEGGTGDEEMSQLNDEDDDASVVHPLTHVLRPSHPLAGVLHTLLGNAATRVSALSEVVDKEVEKETLLQLQLQQQAANPGKDTKKKDDKKGKDAAPAAPAADEAEGLAAFDAFFASLDLHPALRPLPPAVLPENTTVPVPRWLQLRRRLKHWATLGVYVLRLWESVLRQCPLHPDSVSEVHPDTQLDPEQQRVLLDLCLSQTLVPDTQTLGTALRQLWGSGALFKAVPQTLSQSLEGRTSLFGRYHPDPESNPDHSPDQVLNPDLGDEDLGDLCLTGSLVVLGLCRLEDDYPDSGSLSRRHAFREGLLRGGLLQSLLRLLAASRSHCTVPQAVWDLGADAPESGLWLCGHRRLLEKVWVHLWTVLRFGSRACDLESAAAGLLGEEDAFLVPCRSRRDVALRPPRRLTQTLGTTLDPDLLAQSLEASGGLGALWELFTQILAQSLGAGPAVGSTDPQSSAEDLDLLARTLRLLHAALLGPLPESGCLLGLGKENLVPRFLPPLTASLDRSLELALQRFDPDQPSDPEAPADPSVWEAVVDASSLAERCLSLADDAMKLSFLTSTAWAPDSQPNAAQTAPDAGKAAAKKDPKKDAAAAVPEVAFNQGRFARLRKVMSLRLNTESVSSEVWVSVHDLRLGRLGVCASGASHSLLGAPKTQSLCATVSQSSQIEYAYLGNLRKASPDSGCTRAGCGPRFPRHCLRVALNPIFWDILGLMLAEPGSGAVSSPDSEAVAPVDPLTVIPGPLQGLTQTQTQLQEARLRLVVAFADLALLHCTSSTTSSSDFMFSLRLDSDALLLVPRPLPTALAPAAEERRSVRTVSAALRFLGVCAQPSSLAALLDSDPAAVSPGSGASGASGSTSVSATQSLGLCALLEGIVSRAQEERSAGSNGSMLHVLCTSLLHLCAQRGGGDEEVSTLR